VASRPVLFTPSVAVLAVFGVIQDALSGRQNGDFYVVDEEGRLRLTGPLQSGPNGGFAFPLALEGSVPGDADGRIYYVVVIAKDKAGNPGASVATVVVPPR